VHAVCVLFSQNALARGLAVRSASSLKDILAAQIPEKQAAFAKLKKEHGNVSLGEVTIDQVQLHYYYQS
jgi:hypothetical protein